MKFDLKGYLEKNSNDAQRALEALARDAERDYLDLERKYHDAEASAAKDREKRRQAESQLRSFEDQADALKKLGDPKQLETIIAQHQALTKALEPLGAADKLPELLKSLPDQLKSGKEAQEKLTRLERQDLVRRAAETAGYKPSVLETLLERDKLEVKLTEVEQNGKKSPAALVVKPDKTEVALAEFAQQSWVDFIPSLTNGNPGPSPITGAGKAPAGAPKTAEQIQAEKRASGEYNF